MATIALSSFALVGLATLVYYRRHPLPRWVAAAGLAISLTIGGLLTASANLGGQIRHSEIRRGGAAAVEGDARESEER